MDKIDTEKNQESESFPIISDWINFLNSEKHNTVSNVLNFAVLFVALIAIVFAIKVDSTKQVIGNVVFIFVSIGIIYIKVFHPLQKRSNLAARILDRVMSGDIANEKAIREEWKKELARLDHSKNTKKK